MNKILSNLLLSSIIICSINTNVYSKTENKESFAFDTYKEIHQYPELGKKEFRTSEFVKFELKKMGYKDFVNLDILPTAVITVFDSGKPGKTIALRAELDARPNQENTNLNYSSKIKGVMHSCGHDAHAAILLSTAKKIIENKNNFKGKIVFIFQPAEEIKGGADEIVDSGILKKLGVERIFALHVSPGMPVGEISLSPGYTMAGSNYFTLIFKGKGSHAASPFSGDDLLLKSMKISQGLSDLPARSIDISNRPCIISITYFSSGNKDASNILPSESEIKGTIRAFEDLSQNYENQPSIKNIIEKYLESQTKAEGIEYLLKISKGAPPTRNDEELFRTISKDLQTKWQGKINLNTSKFMAAEDFAYYTKDIPALYFNLGIAKDSLGYEGVHTDKFTIHPDSLDYGIRLMEILAEIAT